MHCYHFGGLHYNFLNVFSSSMQLQSCWNFWPHQWMPPSHGSLPLPQSCDWTQLWLVWSRLFQPPAGCRMWEVITWADLHNRSNRWAHGQNPLLRYLPAALRCKCNPIGSSSIACHPITGQCVCHPGVEGSLCDSCRMGFFGFSSRGCRGKGLCLSHHKCTMQRALILWYRTHVEVFLTLQMFTIPCALLFSVWPHPPRPWSSPSL